MNEKPGENPDLLNSLGMAFGFLTVIPVPQRKEWSDLDFGWSAIFFPLTGAVIGMGAAAAYRLFSMIFEKPIAAFLTLIVWILLSGGLHWDGLADCFDGFGCSAAPARRLEIMKDSRLGTYGALGIFCSLLLKWQCIRYLPANKFLIFFALIGASARWAMLLLIRMPLANPNGLAAMLQSHCPGPVFLYAAPVPLILAILYGPFGPAYPAVGLITAWLIGLTAKKKIGGINGDVLGFSIETAEIIMLLAGQVIP